MPKQFALAPRLTEPLARRQAADSLMLARPDDSTLLSDLSLSPLSDQASAVVHRGYAFLSGITHPQLQVPALLGGYTEEVHAHGRYLLRCALGHRPFGEWRDWWAVRPPRDPDMPAHVSELGAFVSKWTAIVHQTIRECCDEEEREENEALFAPHEASPATVWQARFLAGVLETVKTRPWTLGRILADKLRSLGVLRDVARARVLLDEVEAPLLAAPLDDEELRAIAEEREMMAEQLGKWLEERRAQLTALPDAEREALGLGARVPRRTDLLVDQLRPFVVQAKA